MEGLHNPEHLTFMKSRDLVICVSDTVWKQREEGGRQRKGSERKARGGERKKVGEGEREGGTKEKRE